MKQPLTRAKDAEQVSHRDHVSHLDDVDLNPKTRLLSSRVLGLFSAIAFTTLGAVLYAMGTWPWQAAAPSIAVAALQNPPAPALASPPEPARPEPARPEKILQPEKSAPQELPQAALPPVVTPAPAAPPDTPPPFIVLPSPSAEELAQARVLIARAEKIMAETQDIAAARLFLERAAKLGEPRATFVLAQTYDPAALRERGVRGITGDVGRARTLYETALGQGVSGARERLSNLR